jgi:AcrR family transcriptional regulator
MPKDHPITAAQPPKTADLLVEAVLNAWETSGSSAISARAVCGSVGAQVSSLYHHFGSLEQLLVAAQGHAIAAARSWCAQQLDLLADAALPAGALGLLLAGMIDDWCHDQRRIAFAWRECRLNAVKHAAFVPPSLAWKQLWEEFWSDLCGRLAIPQHGEITARFFTGESGYHLIPWNRPVDRAALDEVCLGWSAWLGGQLSPAAPWRAWARVRAGAELVTPPLRDEMEERVATAAAAVVERQGVAGLTYRAVAAEGGMTLGVVSHKFRTGADLVAAAFEVLYRRAADKTPDELANLSASSPAKLVRELAGGALREQGGSVGSDELLLACARDPSLRPFAGNLRYLRGRTSGHYLAAMLKPGRTISHIDAAIFSSFIVGVINAHGLVEDREQRISDAETEIGEVVTVLDG